jgi:outer membrane lipopolysaccharide assembly protein LptE/RlpB
VIATHQRIRAGALAARCLLLLLAALPLGCGYALVGRGINIPPNVQKIYLAPLENATRRSEVEQILTRALSEEMVSHKRFTMVNDTTQADAVLSGRVVGFDTAPLTFDPDGRATQYQITITASMVFKDKGDKVLWRNDRYTYKESYPVNPDATTYFDEEKLAIEQAAGRFARTMVIDLLEGF